MNRWCFLMLACITAACSLNAMDTTPPHLQNSPIIQNLNAAAENKDAKQFFLAAIKLKQEDPSSESCQHARALFYKHFQEEKTLYYGTIKMLLDE